MKKVIVKASELGDNWSAEHHVAKHDLTSGRCPGCGITVLYSSDAVTLLCATCQLKERLGW